MESNNQKILKGKSFLNVNPHSSELKLAQVVDNRAAQESTTSKLFKTDVTGTELSEDANKKKTSKIPQFKIRILGEIRSIKYSLLIGSL